MRDLPEEFDESDLIAALLAGWGFHPIRLEYVRKGFGSYHWTVEDSSGTRCFATVDDLNKVGTTDPNTVFEGLQRAFDTACALRHEAQLEFVVAPLALLDGHSLRRVGPRYTVALFPFLVGQSGSGHEYRTSEEREAVTTLLGRLHGSTSTAAKTAGTENFLLPYRAGLEAAMSNIHAPWVGGPFAEPARRLLAPNLKNVRSLLAIYDRLVAGARAESGGWVITHGEPKASNVMTTEQGRVLIDWDTALVAPPERDLWMVVTDAGEERRLYAAATGHNVNEDSLTLYRLRWDLSEIAGYISWFRLPHVRRADTETGWRSLEGYLKLSDHWGVVLR